MQKIAIIGNVGRDAVTREKNGRRCISFAVAVNKAYKDATGTKIESTNWYDCVIWLLPGASAERSKYIVSGTKVYLEGEPSVRTYTGSDGVTKGSMSINVTPGTFQFLGGGEKREQPAGGDQQGGQGAPVQQKQPITAFDDFTAPPVPSDDDLPF